KLSYFNSSFVTKPEIPPAGGPSAVSSGRHRLRQPLGTSPSQRFVVGFDHDAQQRLGARRPDQHSATAAQLGLDLLTLALQGRTVLPVLPRLEADIDQGLGEQGHA